MTRLGARCRPWCPWPRLGALVAAALVSWSGALTPQQWREDVHLLARELPARHANAFHHTPQTEFERQVRELEGELPRLSDAEVRMRLARLVASVGDAHTGLAHWTQGMRRLPVSLRWFRDGWYVVATDPPHAGLLGAKLLRVGGVPAADIEARLRRLVSFENDAWARVQVEGLWSLVDVLHGVAVLPQADGGRFSFQTVQGEVRELPLSPLRYDSPLFVRAGAVPLYQERQGEAFWTKSLQEGRVAYFKYNDCDRSQRQAFAAAASNLLKTLDAGKVQKVVVDLRDNGGGDSSVIAPLLDGLAERAVGQEPGRLFVLTNRVTFSSAMLNALQFRQRTAATLVGEPTGGKPNSYGEVREFKLPNSGLVVAYSTKFFGMLPGDPVSVEPDVRIEPSVQDFLTGRDPVLDWVLRR